MNEFRREMSLGWALAAIGQLLGGCAATLGTDEALTAVPAEIQRGGPIVVAAGIDGRGPYRFAIDTAATGSFLYAPAQSELGLEPVPGLEARVHGAVASGDFPVIDIDELAIGDAHWANARLIALPAGADRQAAVDGVLGADFLRRYSVGFSSRDRRLSLYLPETIAARSHRGWASIAIEPRRVGGSAEPLHFFDIEVAGRRIPALLDLGAGISLLNSSAVAALELEPAEDGSTEGGRAGEISGAVGSQAVMARLHRQAVRTGSVRWHNEVFLIADLEIFETLGYADRPLAILGSGLFTQRDFIVDFARNRLLVRSAMREIEATPAEATGGRPAR